MFELDDRPKLKLIDSVEELAKNFSTFIQEARRYPERSKKILRRTEFWVRDPYSPAFGPGKFLGFKGMDFDTYEKASAGRSAGTAFKGGLTQTRIKTILGQPFQHQPMLVAECLEWGLHLLGPEAFGAASTEKWKFITLPILGRQPVTSSPDDITPEDLSNAPGDPEGRAMYVRHLRRERSGLIVARKKADAMRREGVLRCEGCDVVLSEVYGPVAADVIECHHIKWLSHTGETVNRLNDLALLCPNCHTITHKARLKSVEELRRIISKLAP